MGESQAFQNSLAGFVARYVIRLRLNHFGLWRRITKKVAINNTVPTSAHTSDVCPAVIPRVRRKMPIINGTTMRKIASLFILVVSSRLFGVFI